LLDFNYKKANKFNTKFVNKYGIAYKCDFYPSIFISDTTQINSNDYKNISAGSLVYVISSALKEWFKEIYPILCKENKVIILVTGDSVINSPLNALDINIEQLKKYKDEGIIYHWFCQNCDVNFKDYITPIPLGIDYHTLHRKPFWGEKKTHFIFQDIYLNFISRVRFNDFHKRKFKLICDIHLNKGNFNNERQIAYQKSLLVKGSSFINRPLSRNKYWCFMRNSQYIISPRGRGFDCHRTWEALALGVVPIIKSSVNDPLFKELPVLIINSYEEINNNLLIENKVLNYINLRKITLQYWVDLIYQKKETLQKEISNIKLNNKVCCKKDYPLSIYAYFTNEMIDMFLSNPYIFVLCINSFIKKLFYPFKIFKDIIYYVIKAMIDQI